MTQANSKLGGAKRKLSKFQIGLVVVIALLVAQYFVITVAMPLMRDNGINKFTGAKKAAAQEVYDLVTTSEIDNKSQWGYKVYVEDVYPTPAGTCQADTQWSKNSGPSDPRYYTVVVRVKELLVYSAGKREIHPGCTKFWLPELSPNEKVQAAPTY